MIQRLAPGTGPIAPEQEPGGNIATTSEDEAGIAAAAQRQADARRLLPAEVEEVSEMSALVPPQGPGIVLGRGMRKLLGAVDGLGKLRAGATADYRRDPATEGGPPSFVSGDTADPDGRITVTADGLLEVTKTKRTPQKAKKGLPALPPKVTHETVLVDLQGKEVALKEGQVVADVFFAQAKSAEERAAAARILVTLRASDAPIAGGTGEGSELTLGELVTEASSGTYRQVSYLDKAKTERSELLKKVMRAFDQIRAEFEAFKPPTTLALFTTYPSHDQLARAFAAKLQPTLFLTAAAAQSELDQATAARATAEAEVAAAKAELTALKGAKGIPKEDKAAHADKIKAATARKTAADGALASAKRVVRQREAARNGLVAERDKFATTIAWILDPSKTTEKRAAATVGSLCNVVSYYLYGKAIGLVPADMDFSDYYLAEVKAARIRYYAGEDAAGVFWGEGSLTWLQQRNLIRLEDPDLAKWKPGEDPVIADPIGHPSRRDELRAFLASSANVALSHQDFENTPPRKAHHFLLIVKGPDGIWRNMDHVTDSYRRRGGITDWNRVFRIEADAALIAQAKAKLEPAPAGP